MRRSGELIQWNNKGGYGFARDDAGQDFYVHISKVTGGSRPRIGDRLSFEAATGRNGRPSAVAVEVEAPPQPVPPPPATLRESIQSSPNVSRYRLGLRTAAATLMTLLILWALGMDRVPLWLPMLYVVMGTGSALLYRFDKLYALSGRYRVSETNLHVADLSFGIIGGLAAQEVYRHKTVKPRFVATTWGIALLHTLLLAGMAFGWFMPLVQGAGAS